MEGSARRIAYHIQKRFQPRVISVWEKFVSERFQLVYTDYAQRFLHGVTPGFHDFLQVEIFVFHK